MNFSGRYEKNAKHDLNVVNCNIYLVTITLDKTA